MKFNRCFGCMRELDAPGAYTGADPGAHTETDPGTHADTNSFT